MSKLPEAFMTRGLELANGSTIFGLPLIGLTREELLAVAAQGWAAEGRARSNGHVDTLRAIDMFSGKRR